jgi:hypothetical protein
MSQSTKDDCFSTGRFVLPDIILSGTRNDTLARAGGLLRRFGCSAGVIETALLAVNSERCIPPLPVKEVCDIAKSVSRYEPDQQTVAWIEGHYQQMVNEGFDLDKFLKTCQGNKKKVEDFQNDWVADICNFDLIDEYPQEWLWENRIPKGTVTILEGPPKVGKTTAVIDWISRLTNGYPMPFTECPVDPEPTRCLILAPEDPVNQVLKPRLMVAGADTSRVIYFRGFKTEDGSKTCRFRICADHLEYLEEIVYESRIGLIYIDAVMGILPEKTDEKSDKEVRQNILDPLVAVAENTNSAIVIGRHWAKGASMRLSFEKGLGSIGWSARARSVLQVAKSPEDPKTRIFCVAASNGPEVPAIQFRIESVPYTFPDGQVVPFGRAEWLAELPDFDPDSLSKAPNGETSSDSAIKWLEDYLTQNGVSPTKAVDEAAKLNGIGGLALKTAKAQMKQDGRIKYQKRADGWWVIPTGATGSTGSSGDAGPDD